jgi:hypothetical protein
VYAYTGTSSTGNFQFTDFATELLRYAKGQVDQESPEEADRFASRECNARARSLLFIRLFAMSSFLSCAMIRVRFALSPRDQSMPTDR